MKKLTIDEKLKRLNKRIRCLENQIKKGLPVSLPTPIINIIKKEYIGSQGEGSITMRITFKEPITNFKDLQLWLFRSPKNRAKQSKGVHYAHTVHNNAEDIPMNGKIIPRSEFYNGRTSYYGGSTFSEDAIYENERIVTTEWDVQSQSIEIKLKLEEWFFGDSVRKSPTNIQSERVDFNGNSYSNAPFSDLGNGSLRFRFALVRNIPNAPNGVYPFKISNYSETLRIDVASFSGSGSATFPNLAARVE